MQGVLGQERASHFRTEEAEGRTGLGSPIKVSLSVLSSLGGGRRFIVSPRECDFLQQDLRPANMTL